MQQLLFQMCVANGIRLIFWQDKIELGLKRLWYVTNQSEFIDFVFLHFLPLIETPKVMHIIDSQHHKQCS